jgi:PAS domain S-box-containing protein
MSSSEPSAAEYRRIAAQLEEFRARLRQTGIDPVIDPSLSLSEQLAVVQEATLTTLASSPARGAEEALRQREQEFRQLFDTTAIGMAQADPQTGRLLRVNAKLAEITGYPEAELLGFSFSQITYADDRACDWEAFQRTVRGETSVHHNVKRFVRKDGTLVWVEVFVTMVRDSAGTPVRTVAAVLDITDRKHAEAERERLLVELQQQAAEADEGQRLLDVLMDFVPEGITIADAPDVTLRMVSRYGSELLGGEHTAKTAEEVASQWTVYRADGVTPMPMEELPLVRAIHQGEVIRNMELVQRNARGDCLWLLCNAGPIRNARGDIVGGIVAWREITDRKRAEEALRESEARYRTLFSSMTEGFAIHEIITDDAGCPVDFRFLEINPAFERLTGLTHEQVVGKTHNEVLPGDDPKWVEMYGAVALTGTPAQFSNYSPALRRHYEVYAFRNAPGQFAVIFLDISDRKAAEEALRRSEARWTAAIESLDVGAIIATEDEQVIYWNPAAQRMHGFTREDEGIEPLAETPVTFQLWTPDARHLLELDEWPMRRIKRGEVVQNLELRIRRPDQGWEKVFSYSGTMVDTAGSERLIFLSCYDITELRRAEETLRQRAEELETVMEVAPVAIWIGHDPRSEVITGNQTANAFYQAQPGENVSANVTPVRRFFRGGHELAPDELPMQEAGARNQDIRNVELDVLLGNGEWRYMLGSASPLRDHAGQVRGTVGAFMDITERRHAEQALRELNETLEQRVRDRTAALERSNKELEAFSYSVSHDLRAPLRSIDGFSKLVLERYTGQLDPQGQDYLQRVRTAAQRMGRLIDDLLNLSRIGLAQLRRVPVNLTTLAASLIEDYRLRDPERRVEVDIQSDLTVEGDATLLRVLLDNLLGNAWKFTSKREDARIEVGSEFRDGACVFFVRDNGAGFDMEYVDKLFSPFQRLHTEDEFPGTGIGLAIVQRIVARHGGRVWAEGAVDHGATLYFTLGD